MRRWQLILELLLHHTPTANSLHLCFPLGRFGRLPLVVCRFLLPWSRFAENRIVLDNVSWQFGPSSFVLGHFLLLGVGFGLDMKWAGVAKFFGPTVGIEDIEIRIIKWEKVWNDNRRKREKERERERIFATNTSWIELLRIIATSKPKRV